MQKDSPRSAAAINNWKNGMCGATGLVIGTGMKSPQPVCKLHLERTAVMRGKFAGRKYRARTAAPRLSPRCGRERSGWLNAFAGEPEIAIKHFNEATRLDRRPPEANRLIGIWLRPSYIQAI